MRQRRYAESACDDAVLAGGSDPCDYAETLLAIAKSNQTAKPMGLAAGSSALRARLRTILRDGTRRSPMTFGKRGMLATLALAIMLPVGACSVAKNGAGIDGRDHIPPAFFAIELSPDDAAKHEQRLAEFPDLHRYAHETDQPLRPNEVRGLRQHTRPSSPGCTGSTSSVDGPARTRCASSRTGPEFSCQQASEPGRPYWRCGGMAGPTGSTTH